MFYSETVLSRRGPLGRVWIAAHMERKLSKAQTLQTDIEHSVGVIIGDEIKVMALRLSGQLLLGVVRIYSRKARYLLEDCNEALLKIKMAFRPGMVDMTEDQLAVNKNAITLQGNAVDLDLLIPDIDWHANFGRPQPAQSNHQAHIDDITLRTAADPFSNFDLNDPFDIGPLDGGIGSQDFLDTGLDFGDSEKPDEDDGMSVNDSIGVGRDLVAGDESFGLNRDENMDLDIFSQHSRAGSEHPFGMDMEMDVPEFDLGINFGDVDEREKTPEQTRSSRGSSPLSDVPQTPPDEPIALPDIEVDADKTPKAKRKVKPKKQVIDTVTELDGGPGAKVGKRNGGLGPSVNVDVSGILSEQQFLPRTSMMIRLLEIRDDPISHFLPTKVAADGTFFCAAPSGLTAELTDLFMRPAGFSALKRRGTSPKGSNKRQKTEEVIVPVEDEVEQGRREASIAPSIGGRSDLRAVSGGPDGTFDFGDQGVVPLDDFQLDIPEMDVNLPEMDANLRGKSAVPSDRSRLSTPAPDGIFDDSLETYADAACPIVMFDSKTQTQTVEKEDEPTEHNAKGYSKNTVKALGLIRQELKPIDDEEEERVLSFRKMADKVCATVRLLSGADLLQASRRAAASFFFELLVLSTRDCVSVEQSAPFENIQVRAKDKLWDRQAHASPGSRAGSVARSLGSALGL
ncbi:unnamed protein product [Mycena citricolor]|uniref:Double-strand-break repair protein rad21 n=1 Tax=Mycena citricolor TaxID=2018698 RepID=A0AAD2HVG4_9AGAR|nr:unnamed protein product [Mycena citricolor]